MSATCWWRRASSTRRCKTTARASPSASASLPPIPTTPVGQRDLSVSYNKVGKVLVVQGKLDEAPQSYRQSLTIRERLAVADRSNTQWQRDLSGSYDNVGNVLVEQGKLDEALQNYRQSLIRERLAAADRGNAEWQRDLSISYNKVGNVLVEQGKLDEALQSDRQSLAIVERLTAADPSNTQWQRDLAVSYSRVGEALVAQGKLDAALESYRQSLAIRERLAAADRSNAQWRNDLDYVVDRIGALAYRLVLAGEFATALEAADQAVSLAPDKILLYTNRANALMFLGRNDEARTLYLKYRGEKNVQDDKSWKTIILEDFDDLRKNGLKNPLMDEVEKTFAARG